MTPEELVHEFTARQPYRLDDFQLEAIRALANRHSVLVAAPTGTGHSSGPATHWGSHRQELTSLDQSGRWRCFETSLASDVGARRGGPG